MSKSHNQVQIISLGTSVPPSVYTQAEIAQLMGIHNPKLLRFFEHHHIKTRHLLLPDEGHKTPFQEESPAKLRQKFLSHATALIKQALHVALSEAKLKIEDLDFIVCITSTGFVVPGLSAIVMEELGFRSDCQRLDVVGMGCNAGLNGLSAVAQWCQSHPDKIGVLICCELCSCIYSLEQNENSAIVNSLFGDGVATAILKSTKTSSSHAKIIDFHSHLIAHSLPLLRFDWKEEKNKHSFYVDKKTPQVLASEIAIPLNNLLLKNNLQLSDITHWIVHSGGAAILEGIEKKLSLDHKAFRHTRFVLERYGNVSSGSFLFSYQQLLNEKSIKPGDKGLFITMGPGLTIEMALIEW